MCITPFLYRNWTWPETYENNAQWQNQAVLKCASGRPKKWFLGRTTVISCYHIPKGTRKMCRVIDLSLSPEAIVLVYIQAMIGSSDISTAHNLPSSLLYSPFSLWNNGKQATWMRRRRRNISVYIDSTGSGGRGWVIHLLHDLVEEGAKVENLSKKHLTWATYHRG